MVEHRFRNRLVGVITLVIFLICFLPAIFQKKEKYIEPSVPLVHKSDDEIHGDNFATAEPFLPLTLNDEPQLPAQVQDNTTVKAPESPKNSANNERYVVQLVALKNARRIEGLVALLVLNNFSVFTKPTKPIDGKMTILYVGPFNSKQQAESELIALKSITKLIGQVKIYQQN